MSNVMNPEMILRGSIDITDNLGFVMEVASAGDPGTVIVNMDEFNERIQGPYVVHGVELLPPQEAIIAEMEGDQQAYDFIYESYYNTPALQLFMAGIVTTLYRGRSILMYFPDLNPAESITIPKLLEMFWKKFGIGIGVIGQRNCSYNWLNSPMWLILMYRHNTISVDEFLLKFPDDAKLRGEEMEKVIMDLCVFHVSNPYAYVLEHQKRLKNNPLVTIPLFKI